MSAHLDSLPRHELERIATSYQVQAAKELTRYELIERIVAAERGGHSASVRPRKRKRTFARKLFDFASGVAKDLLSAPPPLSDNLRASSSTSLRQPSVPTATTHSQHRDEPTKTNGFDEPLPTRTMAKLLAAQGHTERALAIYERLISAEPDDVSLTLERDALSAREARLTSGATIRVQSIDVETVLVSWRGERNDPSRRVQIIWTDAAGIEHRESHDGQTEKGSWIVSEIPIGANIHADLATGESVHASATHVHG